VLSGRERSRTRVVCKANSLDLLKRSIQHARKHGYLLRPTDRRHISKKRAAELLRINKALARMCKFHEIQTAVNAAGNNGRVVIMPGLYTEPTARKNPTPDHRCDNLREKNDRGESNAVSYKYQYKCPHDQNLIAVMGRAPGKGKDPSEPREDRHGIPNVGPCVRCNLQMQGSGVGPDDVIVDAGNVKSGNHAPIDPVKDVGIRADRADGFVLRNLTVRHAGEHDIYILETDGYLTDRTKTFYAGEYGILTFVEDHGRMQNCEAAGNGDSGVYPGASAPTRDQYRPGDGPRFSQEIRWCDSHHNALGYSGTDGDAVHIHNNHFFDNAEGWSTDVFTAAGHPGFPSRDTVVEHNNFYSNNFNPYVKGSDVEPSVPVPVGAGLWIAGGNRETVRFNRFWDNWRRGTMLFAVPDATVCADQHQAGCDPKKVSTSFNNRFYGNIMGVAPNGATKPNGTDFWWDSMVGNTGNCWYGNIPASGRQITMSPNPLPDCNGGRNPSSSIGTGTAPQNQAELANCLGDIEFDTSTCPWFKTPPKPSG